MAINVNVRLLGVFRVFSGKDKVLLELETPTVSGVVNKLRMFLPPECRRMLIDPELNDPRPNALILVNGKEIGTLNGLETNIDDGDEISIVAVTHGG